jgi:hypothetical protein
MLDDPYIAFNLLSQVHQSDFGKFLHVGLFQVEIVPHDSTVGEDHTKCTHQGLFEIQQVTGWIQTALGKFLDPLHEQLLILLHHYVIFYCKPEKRASKIHMS